MLNHVRLNPHLLTVPANIGGKPAETVAEEQGLGEMICLGSNENSFGPSPLALAALSRAPDDLHRYPGIGDRDLRRDLAAFYSDSENDRFTEANFLTGNGLSDILRMIGHAFLCGGGEGIVCTPTFPLYSIFTRMFGGTPIAVAHDHFHYNLPAIADAITPETRVIFLCNPNNPTGTLVSREQVDALMARVPPSVVVVFDESYYDFVEDSTYTDSIEYVESGHENVLVLRGFSKVYGLANLRVGYVLGTQSMIEYLAHAKIVYNTSDAALRAASAALKDQEHLRATRGHIAREREFLSRGFDSLHLDSVPSQTNFILLVNLPLDVKVIDRELLKRGIIVRPMGGFGMPDAIRVTVGRHSENEKLLEALDAILRPG